MSAVHRFDFGMSVRRHTCAACAKTVFNRGCGQCQARLCKACFRNHATCAGPDANPEAARIKEEGEVAVAVAAETTHIQDTETTLDEAEVVAAALLVQSLRRGLAAREWIAQAKTQAIIPAESTSRDKAEVSLDVGAAVLRIQSLQRGIAGKEEVATLLAEAAVLRIQSLQRGTAGKDEVATLLAEAAVLRIQSLQRGTAGKEEVAKLLAEAVQKEPHVTPLSQSKAFPVTLQKSHPLSIGGA